MLRVYGISSWRLLAVPLRSCRQCAPWHVIILQSSLYQARERARSTDIDHNQVGISPQPLLRIPTSTKSYRIPVRSQRTLKHRTHRQVYGLLGKLDLLLKRREDVLWAYHREAEEGAREARALLASAAAQHHPGQAWGVSRPPNVRQLIGGREG